MRYLIIGTTGSGKSTLARALSVRTGIPYCDTDALYWRRDWTLAPEAEVLGRLPLAENSWIIDGNFDDHRPTVWDAADTIVWLYYPRALVLRRVLKRNVTWIFSGRHTWTGRRMPPSLAWSGVRHFLKRYPQQKSKYPKFLESQGQQAILIFRHSKETAEWLRTVPSADLGAIIPTDATM